MRFLVAPVYETPDSPQGDSSWLWNAALCRELTDRGHFVYFLTNVANDGVDGRIERIRSDGLGRFGDAHVPQLVFDHWLDCRSPPLDAIVTNNPIRGLLLQHWQETISQGRSDVPVVTWNVSTKFFDSDEEPALSSADLALWALGYAQTPNVMPSWFALERARDVVGTYLGPPMIRRFDDTASVVYVGPDCNAIDELHEPRFEKLSFYFGGRFTATKGGEKAAEQYVRYLAGGRDADVYVTYVGRAQRLAKSLKRFGAKDLITSAQNLPWVDAIRLMTRCHVSIFWQSLKMFPAACFEQMYAGLVVLIRSDGHEAEFLPPEYPFLFRTDLECAAMLRWVAENLAESQSKVAHVPAWVRERFDRRAGISRLADYLEGLTRSSRDEWLRTNRNVPHTRKLLEDVLAACGPSCTYEELLSGLDRLRPNMLLRGYARRHGELIRNVLYALPERYKDDCLESWPRFVEVEGA